MGIGNPDLSLGCDDSTALRLMLVPLISQMLSKVLDESARRSDMMRAAPEWCISNQCRRNTLHCRGQTSHITTNKIQYSVNEPIGSNIKITGRMFID
jgi:hypothetical protein